MEFHWFLDERTHRQTQPAEFCTQNEIYCSFIFNYTWKVYTIQVCMLLFTVLLVSLLHRSDFSLYAVFCSDFSVFVSFFTLYYSIQYFVTLIIQLFIYCVSDERPSFFYDKRLTHTFNSPTAIVVAFVAQPLQYMYHKRAQLNQNATHDSNNH